jgi:hypothetical protein
MSKHPDVITEAFEIEWEERERVCTERERRERDWYLTEGP